MWFDCVCRQQQLEQERLDRELALRLAAEDTSQVEEVQREPLNRCVLPPTPSPQLCNVCACYQAAHPERVPAVGERLQQPRQSHSQRAVCPQTSIPFLSRHHPPNCRSHAQFLVFQTDENTMYITCTCLMCEHIFADTMPCKQPAFSKFQQF